MGCVDMANGLGNIILEDEKLLIIVQERSIFLIHSKTIVYLQNCMFFIIFALKHRDFLLWAFVCIKGVSTVKIKPNA